MYKLPQKLRDDVDVVDDSVLDFVYANAIKNLENIDKSSDIINSKITNLLNLLVTLVSASSGYLLINHEQLDFAIAFTVVSFVVINIYVIYLLRKALSIKPFSPGYNEVKHYFADENYKLSIYDFKKWELEHMQNSINSNTLHHENRASYFQEALSITFFAPIISLAFFLIYTIVS